MSDETPAKATFEIGMSARNSKTGMVRIIRQINEIEGGAPMLLVRAKEDQEKSVLWSWRADSCDSINAPVTFNVDDYVTLGNGEVVYKIIDTRPHHRSGATQYCLDVDGEKVKWVTAEALHHVAPQQDSVADKMKATDELPTSSDSAQVEAPAKECPTCGRLLGIAETDDPKDVVYHKCWYCNNEPLIPAPAGADTDALFRAAQELAREQELRADAEERAKVAELQVKKLEQRLREMEACVKQSQPVPVMQQTCYEYKTLLQKISFKEDRGESDTELSRHANENWTVQDVSYCSGDTDVRYILLMRIVTTPPQPTRGTAGHHAALTNPFQSPADYQRQPALDAVEILEPVTSKVKLGPIGTAIKEQGVEETIFTMNQFALQGALNRAKERIDATPAFNMRPLLAVKAGE